MKQYAGVFTGYLIVCCMVFKELECNVNEE